MKATKPGGHGAGKDPEKLVQRFLGSWRVVAYLGQEK